MLLTLYGNASVIEARKALSGCILATSQIKFLITEIFVKQICHSNRDETVPLGQTVTDCSIDQPEVIITVFKDSRISLFASKLPS